MPQLLLKLEQGRWTLKIINASLQIIQARILSDLVEEVADLKSFKGFRANTLGRVAANEVVISQDVHLKRR